jgi:tetratricopeptide (TPR) repeat protein
VKDLISETEFYEGVLREKPNHIDALKVLGNLYTESKRYEEGLMIDLKLKHLMPDDPVVSYNLACSYALLGRTRQALDTLRQAILAGYTDYAYMQKDKDLKSLRHLGEFKEIIEWCRLLAKKK